MKICDSHTDFLTEIKDRVEREEYVRSIRKIVGVISCAVFTTNSTISLKDVENFKMEINQYNQKFHTKLLLSIEDLGFIKIVEDLYQLIKLKPISVTLTWNYENQFAGGANTNKGLTKLGKQAIKILEENNILIDTAHLSRKAFYEFSKITTKPIYNSHANVYAIYKHKRNLTDKQIKKIVKSGGYLGLTFYQNFISKEKITLKNVAQQADYLIKKFGYKHFGFGTDLYGFETACLPADFNSYFDVEKLVCELKEMNYSNKIIKAITSKNYFTFINRQNKQ